MPISRDNYYAGPMRNQFHDRYQLLAELKQLIADKLQLSEHIAGKLTQEEPLIGGSLKLDSLDVLELGMYVEEEFGITLGNAAEARAALVNLASLADFIQARGRTTPAFSSNPVPA
jgi:acyl carrier protein